MNQTIGIHYQVQGQDQVAKAFDLMDRGITGFMTKLERVDNVLNRAASLFDRLSSKAERVNNTFSRMNGMDHASRAFSAVSRDAANLNSRLENTTSLTSRLTSRLSGAVGEVRRFGAEMRKAMSGGPGGPGGPGGMPFGETPGGRGARGDTMKPWGMSAYGFMARWWLGYKAAAGARRGFSDVGLAGARQSLLEPGKSLGGVGFSAEQRKRAEVLGQGFIASHPSMGTVPDYLAAMAEAGSATNVNDPMYKGRGVEQLGRVTKAGMKMGALSQMRPPESAKLLNSVMEAQLMQMSPEQQRMYGGEKRGQFAETTAAKIAEIIRVSMIWGKDVQHGLAYSLPSALDKGWSLDTLLGYLGTMKTGGYAGQKAGRGLRAIMEAETGKIANLAIAGMERPDAWKDYQGASKQDRASAHAQVMQRIKERMRTDPFSLFRDIGTWLNRAEERGVDPAQHLKLSRQWIGQMRLTSKPGFVKSWQDASRTVGETRDMRGSDSRIQDLEQDPGYLGQRLDNAWTGLKQSLGRNHALTEQVNGWVSVMNDLTEWNNAGGKFEVLPALKELKDFTVHGVIGGLYDTLNKVLAPLERAVGLLGPNQRPTNFEENLAIIERIPAKISEATKTIGEVFSTVGRGLNAVIGAATQAQNFVSGLEAKIGALIPEWLKERFTQPTAPVGQAQPIPDRTLQRVMPAPETSAETGPQENPEFQLQSYGGGSGLSDAILQLVSVLGQPQNQQIRLSIGDREIKDVVRETLTDDMLARRAYTGA